MRSSVIAGVARFCMVSLYPPWEMNPLSMYLYLVPTDLRRSGRHLHVAVIIEYIGIGYSCALCGSPSTLAFVLGIQYLFLDFLMSSLSSAVILVLKGVRCPVSVGCHISEVRYQL